MPSWNEVHYERAQEFLQRIAAAIAGSPPPAARPMPPAAPTPSVPAAPLLPPPPVPGPAAAPAAPASAGSVFKKIQWKK